MMAKPTAGSYTKEENENTHEKSDFPKLGISYHTYSLTSLGGRREHPGEGQQGRGRLSQQAVTTRWASMKLEGGSQQPAWEVTGARLYTVPLDGGGTRMGGTHLQMGKLCEVLHLECLLQARKGERSWRKQRWKMTLERHPVPALSAIESQASTPTTAVGTRARHSASVLPCTSSVVFRKRQVRKASNT